mgnify:CR=1 FL=1
MNKWTSAILWEGVSPIIQQGGATCECGTTHSSTRAQPLDSYWTHTTWGERGTFIPTSLLVGSAPASILRIGDWSWHSIHPLKLNLLLSLASLVSVLWSYQLHYCTICGSLPYCASYVSVAVGIVDLISPFMYSSLEAWTCSSFWGIIALTTVKSCASLP